MRMMLQIKRNVRDALGNERAHLSLRVSIANFIENIRISTGHFSYYEITIFNLSIYSFKNSLAEMLLINTLRHHVKLFRCLLYSKFIDI
ncbi:MAG: hypothetical protein EA406_14385 [Rhodospirillales bacterium]|nr:MAG: hypothetical protein EA406_14385 [Rhodospirillales bacterium]